MTLFGEGEAKPEGPSSEAWGVARAVKSDRKPEPRMRVTQMAALVQSLLDAGHSIEAVLAAMLTAPTVSQGSVEIELVKIKARTPRNARAGQWSDEQQSGPVRRGEWSDD